MCTSAYTGRVGGDGEHPCKPKGGTRLLFSHSPHIRWPRLARAEQAVCWCHVASCLVSHEGGEYAQDELLSCRVCERTKPWGCSRMLSDVHFELGLRKYILQIETSSVFCDTVLVMPGNALGRTCRALIYLCFKVVHTM